VNVRNFDEVMGEVRDHFDPLYDFVMIPRVPLDTLDFTSRTMNLGSRMIIDATRKRRGMEPPPGGRKRGATERVVRGLRAKDRRIVRAVLVNDALLLVSVRKEGRQVVERLVRSRDLAGVAVVAAVSEDVNLDERESSIWGIFTRFDCERDLCFTRQEMIGASPVYEGVLGIDATWKEGFPEPLRMTDGVRRKVEERWETYWK
jgi:4-hydroxy-3-polyprenylbenzoate decarboxylase